MMTETAEPKATDALGLTTISNEGAIPKARLSDPKKCQDIGAKLVEQGRARSLKNAKILGQIGGNKPVSPAALRAAAQSWRTNVNFRESKGALSAALTPFYDLLTGSKFYFSIRTKFGETGYHKDMFSQAITEEAFEYVDEWDGFDTCLQAMLFDFVLFGRGFLRWPVAGWKFDHISHHQVYVPDGTKIHSNKVPFIVIREDLLATEVWKSCKRPNASAAGWDVEACKRAIKAATPPRRDREDLNNFEARQQRIKDNDLEDNHEAAKVSVYHFLVQEFDGKISHLIVPEKPLPTDGKNIESVPFLYRAMGEYPNLNEAFSSFFFETLDASWNGATGIGDELFDMVELKNRLKGSIVDGAFVRSALTLKPTTANSIQNVSLAQIGAFNILPPDFEAVNTNLLSDLSGPISADRLLDSTLAQNTGIFRPKVDKPEGNPRTAEEVRLNFQASATLSSSAVNRFYKRLDVFYRTLVKRLVKDPEFRKRCKDRGIPPEALDKIDRVQANRVVGNGSAFMRQQAQQMIGPLVPMMPEAGRMQWARDTVASVANQALADRYFPQPEDEPMATDHAAYAQLENAALKMGSPVLWTPTQNNVIHAQTHLQFASMAAESLSKGAQPMDVLATIQRVGPHAYLHISKVENDPTRATDVKALMEEWTRLSEFADQLEKKIQEDMKAQQEQQQAQAQAQQVQQGLDPDSQIKMAKAQQEMAIKGQKAQQALQQKTEAHNLKMATKDAQVAAGIAIQNKKLEQQKQNEQGKTEGV